MRSAALGSSLVCRVSNSTTTASQLRPPRNFSVIDSCCELVERRNNTAPISNLGASCRATTTTSFSSHLQGRRYPLNLYKLGNRSRSRNYTSSTTSTAPKAAAAAMSSKLIPSNPEDVMVIRNVTPNIVTFSVPFLRFGSARIGGRGTLGMKSLHSVAAVRVQACVTNRSRTN
jgi:hypothetical protein